MDNKEIKMKRQKKKRRKRKRKNPIQKGREKIGVS